MKKKILGLITTLSLLIGMLVPITSVSAALGISHEKEVSLMAALGIVPGYPYDYNASAAVSKNDFIKWSFKAIGVEITNPADYLSTYGFAQGDEQITIEQAARVSLDIAGYSPIVEASKVSYYEYATKGNILRGVVHSGQDYGMNTEGVAVLLYNIIDLKTVELENREYSFGNETIMENKLEIHKEKGVITANNETGLSGFSSVSKNNVRIDSQQYNVGNTAAAQMLGQSVDFYYYNDKKNGEYVIKWIESNSTQNKSLTIYGCDISSINGLSVKYDSNSGNNKTASIAPKHDIIYNGKLNNNLSIDVMNSLTSETTLINNGSGSGYNIIIVNDYSYYFVDSYTASSMIVSDYSARKTISLDEEDYNVFNIYKDGIATTVSSVLPGQVLAVVKSEDGGILRVEIITGSVSGEISSYSDDEVVIGDTRYDISPAYEGDQLKNGRTGTFYFDRLGKVVRCSAMKSQTSKYGYLMKFFSDEDGESGFTARILTAEGTVKEFKVKDSISFNSTKTDVKDAYNKMYDGTGVTQLIQYSLNSENIVTSIKTADKKYIGVDEENIDEFTMNYKGTGKYRKNNMSFNAKYLIDNTTPIFLVPYNGESDEYSVQNLSYLVNSTAYDISVYDLDSYMYAGAIVLKENLIEPENLRSKRAFIISKVVEAVDDEGEECVMLEGYQKGSKITYYIDGKKLFDNRGTVLASNLKEGDVIQFGTNSKGKINAFQILYSSAANSLNIASGSNTPNEYWEGATAVFPDLFVSCGKVTDRNSEVLLVDSDGDDTVVTKRPHKLGSTSVYLYENGKLTSSNKNEITVGDSVYVQEYQGNVQDVIVVR